MKKISIIIATIITCANLVFAQYADYNTLKSWAGYEGDTPPNLASKLSVDFYTKYCYLNFFLSLNDIERLKIIKNQFSQFTTNNGNRLIQNVTLQSVEDLIKMELAQYENPVYRRSLDLYMEFSHYKPEQLGKIAGDEHYEKLKWLKENLKKNLDKDNANSIAIGRPPNRDIVKILDNEWDELCSKHLEEYGDVYKKFSPEEIYAIRDYSLYRGIDEDFIKKEIEAYNNAAEIIKIRTLLYCREIVEWVLIIDKEWKDNPQRTFNKVVSRIKAYRMYYHINIPEKTNDEFFIRRINDFKVDVIELCVKDYCKLINQRNALLLAVNKIKFIKNRFKITDDILSYGNVGYRYNQAENHLNTYKNTKYEQRAEMDLNLVHNLKYLAKLVLGEAACLSDIHSATSKGKTIQVYPIKKDEKSRYIVASKDYDAVFAIPSNIILPEECNKIDSSLKGIELKPLHNLIKVDDMKLENISSYLADKTYSADTLFKIGLCYFWGKGGAEKNIKKAYEYFLDSAEKGNMNALRYAVEVRLVYNAEIIDKQQTRIIDYSKKFLEKFESERVLGFLVGNSMVYNVGYISKEEGLRYLWRLYYREKNPMYLYALANHYYYEENEKNRGISLFLKSDRYHSYGKVVFSIACLPEERFFGMFKKQ